MLLKPFYLGYFVSINTTFLVSSWHVLGGLMTELVPLAPRP
jgi:hypothetical protein